jgi:hypothetical protein
LETDIKISELRSGFLSDINIKWQRVTGNLVNKRSIHTLSLTFVRVGSMLCLERSDE